MKDSEEIREKRDKDAKKNNMETQNKRRTKKKSKGNYVGEGSSQGKGSCRRMRYWKLKLRNGVYFKDLQMQKVHKIGQLCL